MTEREPSDLGVGDRRRYYQMGVEDGLQMAKGALTDEELLTEVVMRGLDYHRPLDEERLRKTAHDSFQEGVTSGMERAESYAMEKALRQISRTVDAQAADRKAQEDLEAASQEYRAAPFDIIPPAGKMWWEFWK